MTMVWTQAQIDNMRALIAEGIMTVEYDGHRTTYQNMTEMRKALAQMLADNAAAAGTGSISVMNTSKGL